MVIDNNKDRVMIIDDDAQNQRVLFETLEGTSVLKTYSNGEEALKDIDAYLPNLVILDVAMPGMSGYEVCKKIRLKESLKFTKIILVSGRSSTDEKIKGYKHGADDYVTKPFIPSELTAKIKAFLRLSYIERELNELNQELDKKVQEKTQELYETQTKLMNAAKMAALGEMAGGIAHEINNPLATIGILGEQIQRVINIDANIWKPTVLEMANTIVHSVKHIAGIVSDLRTFSNTENQDALTEASLKKIILSTLSLCQSKFAVNHVQIIVDDMKDDLVIHCRPTEISQVVLNLISNSYDALMESNASEKWIRISCEEKGDGVVMSITDSGKGIPKAIRDKIFQPLFTTKEIGKGTGLGLSVSKGIVEGHMGNLTLNEGNPNTEFLIYLPKNSPNSKK